MKRLLILISLFFMLLGVWATPAFSSTLTVEIEDLEAIAPDSIWSYQMNFDICGDGTVTGLLFNNTAGPTGQFQWEVITGTFVSNGNFDYNVIPGELIVLSDSQSFGVTSNLINGELFTVTYGSATTLSLTLASFLLTSDLTTPIDLFVSPGKTFGDGDHTMTLSAVPIPGALVLFASGLIGMVGIRRKLVKL